MHLHGGDIYKNKNMIDFSANINMLGTPQGVIDAACEGVKLSMNYPDINCFELKEALSKEEGIPQEYIMCGNGAAELVFAIVLALKPKKAILPVPSFYEYEQALRNLSSCEIQYEFLKEEEDFKLTNRILDKIVDGTDIIFLCNPNNPTGMTVEKELLVKIVEKCEQSNTLLVLDECFNDMLDDWQTCSMKESVLHSKNIFILKAFTKLYAMAGLRLGYGFCSDRALLEKMKGVLQPWNVSIPAQMAGVAALKEKEHVAGFRRILTKERAYLLEELNKLVPKVFKSQANYIFFKAEEDFYQKCYESGFLVRDCGNYIGLTKGYYRIAVKDHEKNKGLIEAIKKFTQYTHPGISIN